MNDQMRFLALMISCFVLSLQSLAQKKIPLTKEELGLLPYEGNETLIFKSNRGDYDTIRLVSSKLGYPDGPKPQKYSPQNATIYGNFSDPNSPNGKHRYLYGQLFEVFAATPDGGTRIGIYLKAKNAVFYGPTIYSLKKFNDLPVTSVEINQSLFDDVVIMRADTLSKSGKEFKKRKNFVSNIYWSKAFGLLKYEKRDREVWIKIN